MNNSCLCTLTLSGSLTKHQMYQLLDVINEFHPVDFEETEFLSSIQTAHQTNKSTVITFNMTSNRQDISEGIPCSLMDEYLEETICDLELGFIWKTDCANKSIQACVLYDARLKDKKTFLLSGNSLFAEIDQIDTDHALLKLKSWNDFFKSNHLLTVKSNSDQFMGSQSLDPYDAIHSAIASQRE